MFNKLLRFFVLASILKAELINFEKFSLQNNTITWDQTGSDKGYFAIDTDDGVLPWIGSASSRHLSVLPLGYNSSGDFEIEQTIDYAKLNCTGAQDYYEKMYFDLEAIAILAYDYKNITPSDYQLFNCHPKQLKIITDEKPNGISTDYQTGCDIKYSSASRLSGISPQSCYGKEGSYNGTCKATCIDNKTDLIKYGQNLRFGSIQSETGISQELLRKLIARFGPLLAYNNYYERYQIYYGWNFDSVSTYYHTLYRLDTDLVVATEVIKPWPLITNVSFFAQPLTDCTNKDDPQFRCYCTSTNYPVGCICPIKTEGLIGIPIDRCSCQIGDVREECYEFKCTNDILPAFGCTCTQRFHPRRCKCPSKAEDLVGIPKLQCKCIGNNDPREQCKCFTLDPQGRCKCTGVNDSSNCLCPKDPEELLTFSKDKCKCVSGDLRSSCSVCKGEINDDKDCICPNTAEDLIQISSRKCQCIKGDTRNECKPTQCTNNAVPELGCICARDFHPNKCTCSQIATFLEGVPVNQCGCVSDDYREGCRTKDDKPSTDKTDALDKSGCDQLNVLISVIAVVVLFPALAMLL